MPFVGLANGQIDYLVRSYGDGVLRPEYIAHAYFEGPTLGPAGETFVRVYREMPSGVGLPESCQHMGAGVVPGRPSSGQLWPRGAR